MKIKDSIAKKGLYIGAGLGLLMFAIIGLLPSSFIGGVLGLKLAGHIFGTPLGMAVLPRIVVGISMVLAVLVTGLVFVMGLALIGWLLGQVIDVVRASKTVGIDLKTKEKKA
jgi:hypothetical protein